MGKATFAKPESLSGFSTLADVDRLLSREEAAYYVNTSAEYVSDHANRSEPRIPVVRQGSLLKFRAADILEYIENQLNAPPVRKPRRKAPQRVQIEREKRRPAICKT